MKERKDTLKKRLHAGTAAAVLLAFLMALLAAAIRSALDFSWLNTDLTVPEPAGLGIAELVFRFILYFSGWYALILWVLSRLWRKSPAWKDWMHPNRELSDAGIYGTSVFEQPWDYRSLAQIRPIGQCHGIILGQLGENGEECIDYYPDPQDPTAHINSNIFAIGASGSGKTYTVGKNYCYQSLKRGHSLVITDPKGELFADTADLFRKAGYLVRRLDFINLPKSDGWDCMKPLRTAGSGEQVEITANRFATAVVSNIGSEGIYYDGSLLLLKALLLRVVLDDTIPEEEKNILKVYSWLTDPGGSEFLDRLFDESVMPKKLRPCLQPYNSIKGSSANLLGNIKTNLAAGIQILSTGIIADILSTDDIDLTLPGKERCAYYIQFPVPNDAYRFPIALFFTMIFQSLMDFAGTQDSLHLPVPVDFLLDEFAQCGVLPNWAQLISVIRSYGLSAFMIVQTSAQFLSSYGDDADTIRSNCAIWLMLGANDLTSAEYFCKRVGKTTVKVRSESRYGLRKLLGIRNSLTDRTSEGTGGSELLSTDEIMKLPPNHAVIVFQRHNPVLAATVPHTLHPYSRIPDKTYDRNEPNLTDREERKRRRLEEERTREAALRNHPAEAGPPDISDAPYRREPTFRSDLADILREDLAFLTRHLKAQKTGNRKEPDPDDPCPPGIPDPDTKAELPGRPEPAETEPETLLWEFGEELSRTEEPAPLLSAPPDRDTPEPAPALPESETRASFPHHPTGKPDHSGRTRTDSRITPPRRDPARFT